MGIHYDYKSTRGEKAMRKEAKRRARLEQRRGFVLVFIESVVVYCQYIIKKTFVKVVRGSAISSV